MRIYLYVDANDLEAIAEPIAAAIEDWRPKDNDKLQLVNQPPGENSESQQWRLGINIETKKKKALVKPVEFLYGIAKAHECEFVVGVFDDKTGEAEDVCYFGYEEGRPDVNEMANYLGL